MSDPNVIRIKPQFYIHVLDNNTNITRLEVGPKTFTRQEHEVVVSGPTKMVMVPPRSYCVISNPVVRDEGGRPVSQPNGLLKLRYGDEEIRFEGPPFPLYPGESLVGAPQNLKVPSSVFLIICSSDPFVGGSSQCRSSSPVYPPLSRW